MSRIAPNFGRVAYDEHVSAVADEPTEAPENVQGLRRDATMLIVVSTAIAFVFPALGAGGAIAGVLWLMATKPATVATSNMASDIRAGDRGGGCFWYVATLAIGAVAFVLGLFILGAFAMAGR